MKNLLRLLILLLAGIVSAQEYALNPSFDAPYSRAIVWADAMERARTLSPTGTRLLEDVQIPPGTWTVTWTGGGNAYLDGSGVRQASRSGGRATYSIQRSSRPLRVRWTGQVENLHVWLPGVEGKELWPPFVAWMKDLRPVALRTLDWTMANVPPQDRDGRVVPAALQVELVNAIGCGLHYPIPVGESETALVDLFRILGGVRGEVTLEVGNENWNSGLWSYRWLEQQGGRVVDANAREIERVFAIAERELPRARHFVGGHLQNQWFLEETLRVLPRSVRVDAAGGACYVGPRGTPATAQAFVAECMAAVERQRANVRECREDVLARGARFELYEAGSSGSRGGGIVADAQRHPGMGDVYRALGSMLAAEDVKRVSIYSLATSYDISNVYPFGVFEGIPKTYTISPKAQAVIDLMRASN